jgi:hypothetical protein
MAARRKLTVQEELIQFLQEPDPDETILWWLKSAYDEANATVVKAREYGSGELIYAGHVMNAIHEGRALSFGEDGTGHISDAVAAETQIFHYVLGKMGRWVAAMTRHEPVSDDTLFDIGVYVRMIQRIRASGAWP